MHSHEEIILTRDCEAIVIPQGHTTTLQKGTRVVITQSLGGSYTVATEGYLARITGQNADALGFEVSEPAAPSAPEGAAVEVDDKAVWDQLRNCYDPEIPVNIVDLGLVYDCAIDRSEGAGAAKVHVKMTLTAPGCGMGPSIAAEARSRILSVPGVAEAEVELVWEPVWNQAMISEAGKMKLGVI